MAQKNIKSLFITFEGSEGSGKSTQSRLLYLYLKRKGHAVLQIREPGSTIISEKIRAVLLDPKNKKMSALAETLLYMSARSQLVQDVIAPALAKGKIVICDRFLDATLAYQGYGNGVDIRLIKSLGRSVTKGIKPDITFFMDLNVREGLRRAGKVKDRIEQRPLKYHERVRRGYLSLAKAEPGRIKIIPVERFRQETQQRIRGFMDKLV